MQIGKLLKNSGLAALAAALAMTALPAHAQQAQRGWNTRESSHDTVRARSSQGGDHRSQVRVRQSDNRSARTAQSGAVRQWRLQPRTARVTEATRGNDRSDRTQWQDHNRTEDRTRTWQRDGDRSRTWERDRNGDWRDNNGTSREQWGWRNGSRERDWDNDGNRDRDSRDSWRDRDHREARNNYRQWDRRWRDDDRYDWYRYRSRNRNTFHLGIYYAPYRNYSYRRLNPGFYLDTLFYSDRYWLADPWRYRLPDVYGPYRWIRYYDDALLVDIYSGEVVDVIYDFFW